MAPAITRLASARVRVMRSILSGQELTRTLALVESPRDLVTQILLQRNARRGLGRRVRSERAHRSSEQRERLGLGVAVLMLTPRALDGNDHLLGRMDVNVLAEGAERQKGAGVDAGRPVRQHPPLVAVSHGGAGHEPTEARGRAAGLWPARSRQPGGRTRRALNASPSSNTSWPKRPTSRRRALTASDSRCQHPSPSMPAGAPDRLGAVVGQRPTRGGREKRAEQAAVAGRIVEDDTLRLSVRQAAPEVQDGAWPPAH